MEGRRAAVCGVLFGQPKSPCDEGCAQGETRSGGARGVELGVVGARSAPGAAGTSVIFISHVVWEDLFWNQVVESESESESERARERERK